MAEDILISNFKNDIFANKPLIPNCWTQSHLCDKQLNFFDLDISQEIIDSFFEEIQHQNEAQVENEEEKDGSNDYLENGDISLNAFIQDVLQNLPNIGEDIAEEHRNRLLNGHCVMKPDEIAEQNMYF